MLSVEDTYQEKFGFIDVIFLNNIVLVLLKIAEIKMLPPFLSFEFSAYEDWTKYKVSQYLEFTNIKSNSTRAPSEYHAYKKKALLKDFKVFL